MKALTTAIYAKCAAGTSLHTAIGGRLCDTEAPAGTDYPYVVYKVVTFGPDNTFTERLDRVLLQFSIFSNASSSGEIKDILGYLAALYDDCALTITGETLLSMSRKPGGGLIDKEPHTTPSGEQSVWAAHVDYSIMTKVG